jgi:hypothetical protein
MKNLCDILWKKISIAIVILFFGLVIICSGCSGGDFTGYKFTISGAVYGVIAQGVTIDFIDDHEQQLGVAITNSLGGYTFIGLSKGTYIIRASLSGYKFTPTSQVVTINDENVTGINFISDFTSEESTSGE